MDIDHPKKVIKIPTPSLWAVGGPATAAGEVDMGIVDMGFLGAPRQIYLYAVNNLYLCAISIV